MTGKSTNRADKALPPTAVAAETEWANPASVRVLSKAGFAPSGPATESGGARFEFLGGA